MEFMQPLAHGGARPSHAQSSLPLTQAQCLDGLCQEAPALGAVEATRRLRQPRTHFRAQFHGTTSLREVAIIQESSGRIIFLKPPKAGSIVAISQVGPRSYCTRDGELEASFGGKFGRGNNGPIPGGMPPLGKTPPGAYQIELKGGDRGRCFLTEEEQTGQPWNEEGHRLPYDRWH